MVAREDVDFKTLDGLSLRGWVYPAAERGPAVILTPGFNLTKELLIAEVAEYLQKVGFTALAYDPRSIGSSDGLPRNEIDPMRNMEDYHDALTFLKSHPQVDPSRIALWGYSFSGMISICAAALDKRAKAVIAMCPLTEWDFPPEKWPKVLKRTMQDRESQLAGNKPIYIPMITENGENPAGFGGGFDKGQYELVTGANEAQLNVDVETTLSSYYKIAAFQPWGLVKHVGATPVMIITAELDTVSSPDKQKSLLFDTFEGEKKLLVVPGKGHMNVLSGDNFVGVLGAMVEFLREVL